jgi:tetratricopeptide (TPR) repeat protein
MKPRASVWAGCWLLSLGLACGAIGRQQSDNLVEPSDLERRPDLIGREVVVDDRVRFYVVRKGTEDDQLELKRTSVPFRVPQRLRPTAYSRMTAVVVQGVLKRDEGRLVCDVTSLQIVPNDLERLERGLAALAPRDSATRKAWAKWAERRAADFSEEDGPLMKRARELEAEVLRLEGEMKRGAVDAPQEWLAMAQDARRRKVAEPGPSALAHKALWAKLEAAKDAARLEEVVREITAFFPDAPKDQASARVDLARWEAPYANDPEEAYRTAGKDYRKALDRRLWADAQERLLDRRPIPDLAGGVALAEQAAGLLPEKPDLSARLLRKTVDTYRKQLAGLRLQEVKALAEVYRDKLKQPDEALKVLHDWLEIKRARLSETDAYGPVSLAGLYEDLLQDRVTAVELLRKAWKIDPTSRETEEAFRLRGFRKAKDDWVEIRPGAEAGSGSDTPKAARAPVPKSQGLLGLTADEVKHRMNGRPSRVNYTASMGQLIEQWIYHLDNKTIRYVNLVHAPGTLRPRVVADYTLTKVIPNGGSGSAR